MKPVTNEMLAILIQKIQAGQPISKETNLSSELVITGTSTNTPMNNVTLALMGKLQSPAETPAEIAKLNSALIFLSSDTEYGDGRFYTTGGDASQNYWLAAIWGMASLGFIQPTPFKCNRYWLTL